MSYPATLDRPRRRRPMPPMAGIVIGAGISALLWIVILAVLAEVF